MPDVIPLVLLHTSSCECDRGQAVGNDEGEATDREEDERGETTAGSYERVHHGSCQKVARACSAQANAVGDKRRPNRDRQHHATDLPSNVLRVGGDEAARYVQSREEEQEGGMVLAAALASLAFSPK